ncbi:potassium channel family protein [Leifsonia sp. NPDC058248]|uniref:potassium channel family protein n=1 Tax=Leifsonia sp. NPDC058248 TaxID=3346402 RepID=UPI0036DF721D
MAAQGNLRARKRWEDATAWPLIAASVLFLIAYSWGILEPRRPGWLSITLAVVLVLVWVLFVVDFVVRLSLSPRKWEFVRQNPIDLASVLLPLARPFRLLKELSKVPLLRGNTGQHLRRRVVIIAASFVVMFIYVISLAVYSVERDAPGASITSFGDSVWWAIVTMATVGYGDYVPVTVTGRVLAVLLMIGGVGIVGTASATIVTALNDRTAHLRQNRDDHSHGHELGHSPELDLSVGDERTDADGES